MRATDLDENASEWKAERLAMEMPAFAPGTSCAQVFSWFREHPEQVAAAIVDNDGRVHGIANRLRFLARYAQPYIPELYARQPIARLANARPLIVDADMPLIEVATMVTLEWPDALRECFVVTREGRYCGIGTSEALVRAKLHMLAARERQLHAALDDAQAASKAKGNFLALMSHELRTPLNAIIGFSEVLSFEMFGPHAVARYRDYSADIHGAGRHLLALINDILDLSKSEAGKMDLHDETLDLSDIFETCRKLVADRAREGRVRLTAYAGDAPLLRADALRLKQILLNLLSNAVKFTEPGGRVGMTAATTADGGVTICVADTGIGMAPETIPIALEPFRQIASPLARTAEGTGLGLSLVKTLVEQHGGALRIESALREGTRVFVQMPAHRSETRGMQAAACA